MIWRMQRQSCACNIAKRFWMSSAILSHQWAESIDLFSLCQPCIDSSSLYGLLENSRANVLTVIHSPFGKYSRLLRRGRKRAKGTGRDTEKEKLKGKKKKKKEIWDNVVRREITIRERKKRKVQKNVTLLRGEFALRGRNRTADFLMRCYPLQSDAMNQLDHPEDVEELTRGTLI